MLEFFLLFLAIGSQLSSANGRVENPSNIFILAGQSNMAGRGGVVNHVWDRYVPPECKPNPRVLRFTAGLRWVEAEEPLHRDIDVTKTCGIGPGMSFANSLISRSPNLWRIGLVPCAIGGSKIRRWERGADLYNQLIKRAYASVKGGGTIRAILWYQGESDTNTYEDAIAYKNNLERFLTDVRADLGSPYLPVILVALASAEGRFIDIVRAAQWGIRLPDVSIVDAKGFELEPDHLHLTTQSQVWLGEKLADAFLKYT